MSGRGKNLLGTAVLALLAAVSGCGKAQQEKDRAEDVRELQQVYALYAHHADENNGKGPEGKKQLGDYSEGTPEELKAYHGVVGGKFTLIWGVNLGKAKLAEDPESLVLGYHRETPTKGGLVLFVDGSVKEVSAEDFAGLKQADPEKISFGGDGSKKETRDKRKKPD